MNSCILGSAVPVGIGSKKKTDLSGPHIPTDRGLQPCLYIAAPFQTLKLLLHHMKSQFWVVLSAHHFLRDGSKFFILTIWLFFLPSITSFVCVGYQAFDPATPHGGCSTRITTATLLSSSPPLGPLFSPRCIYLYIVCIHTVDVYICIFLSMDPCIYVSTYLWLIMNRTSQNLSQVS